MENEVEVRREDAAATLILALPAIIDSRTTLLAHHSAQLGIGAVIAGRIRVGEGYTIEGHRNNHTIAGYLLTRPCSLYLLARHILDDEELVALRAASGRRHLDERRVRHRITGCILDVIAISAKEVKTLDRVPCIRLCAIRHQRRDGIGGNDESTTVIDHIIRHDRSALFVAKEADVLVMIIMGRHQEIDSTLEVRCRCLPSQTALFARVFGTGCHPYGIDIISFYIKLDILVFIYTHIDIDIFDLHLRVEGYTEHIAYFR